MNATKTICTNCVMDTTDSAITFDARGVCDHCNTFYTQVQPHWHTGERGKAELDRMVETIQKAGKGKDYDCIIGMSGGIDSSYLVHAAKEVMGLRPLVFHVDAGWNSHIAVNNIERLVDGLGPDLFTEVIDWEEMRTCSAPSSARVCRISTRRRTTPFSRSCTNSPPRTESSTF